MRGDRTGKTVLAPPPASKHRPHFPMLLWLTIVATAGPLVACYGPDHESVHFRGDRPDFFRMPQPWRGVPEERRAMAPSSFDDQEQELKDGKRLIALSLSYEAAGRFRQAAAAWTRIRELRMVGDIREWEDWRDPPQLQGLDDRIAALRTWRGPRDNQALRLYLRARDLVNAGRSAGAGRVLAGLTQEPFRARADYLRAGI